MKIYLDDERPVPDGWQLATTPLEFFNIVVENLWKIDEVSFDHDLGDLWLDGKEISGYDCLQCFIQIHSMLRIPFPKISLHTANPQGWERMELALNYVGLYLDMTYYEFWHEHEREVRPDRSAN